MAIVAPFRGIRYNTGAVDPLDRIVAPPYDVLTAEQRANLIGRSIWNILRIDMPVGDGETKYRYAGGLWRRWQETGVLQQDDEPALYLVEETFISPLGKPAVRHGFIAELLIEDLGRGTVLPHERTFAGPKADRLQLMRATQANTSQVFMLYRDPDGDLRSTFDRMRHREPEFDFAVDYGARRMWRATDTKIHGLVAQTVARYPVTIADGHHRYETAIAFRDECRRRGACPAAESLMVYLSCSDDPNLTILPTHRIIKFSGAFSPDVFHSQVGKYFDLVPVHGAHPEVAISEAIGDGVGAPYRFGFLVREKGWHLATLRSWNRVAEWIDPIRCDAWRGLDVALLHEVVLKRLAGLSDAEGSVKYTIDPRAGIEAVASGTADLFCYIRPTAASQVADVASAGDVMPHKSTYFYPKLLTGLVMRSLCAE